MRVLRYALFALIAFNVLAFGGVEEWARAVFEIGASLLFLAWCVRAFVQRQETVFLPSLLLPFLGFVAVVTGQWLFRLTASPFQTRVELQLLVADFLVLFLASQLFQTVEDWRSLCWFVMLFGFLVAGFGILQHLTFDGKLYWFREMHYGGIPFGPYVNRNHFAGFAELIIPIGLVPLVMGKVRRERRFIVGILVLVPLVAVFLSASRGGIISIGVEFCVLLILLLFRRSLGKHALAGALVLGLAFLLVSWLGVSEIIARFSTLQSLEVTETKRASMRHGSWHIFLDHPIVGTGFNTLQTIYPPYETHYDGKIVNHSHNDYLEALAETGILGGLCCAWFLALLLFQAIASLDRSNRSFTVSLHLAGLVACVGFLTHSLVDFNLHIPANALLFLLIALLATASVRPANQTQDSPVTFLEPALNP
jgi:O-antigen ligase